MVKISKKDILLIAVLFLITILRLGIFIRVPYIAVGGSFYDGNLLTTLADYITKGWWLGDYSYVTLVKGASYPVFLAISNWLCMPYSMLLGLLYIAAAICFAFAILKLSSNKAFATIAYLLILFNPYGLSGVQSIYRDAVVFPSVIIIISALLLTFYYSNKSFKYLCLWSVILGLALSFFYYIREDSIWILPLIIISIIIISCNIIFFSHQEKKKIIKNMAGLSIFIVLFVGITVCYKSMNYYKYGVWTVNDRSRGSFSELVGNIIKIEDETNDNPAVWISRNKLEKIVNELPGLEGKEDVFLDKYDTWSGSSSSNVTIDIPVWIIREALNELGYYKDANTAEAFCKQLNQELLDAVHQGKFEFDDAIHVTNICRGIYRTELPDLVVNTLLNTYKVATFTDRGASLSPSSGGDGFIRSMESTTAVNTIKQTQPVTYLGGWIVLKKEPIDSISLSITDGNKIQQVNVYDWTGVIKYYEDYDSSYRKKFGLEFEGNFDLANTTAELTINGKTYDITEFDTIESEDFVFYVDYLMQDDGVDPYSSSSSRVVTLSNNIIGFYKLVSPIMFVLSIISLVILLIHSLRTRKWLDVVSVIFPVAVITSMETLEFGITLFFYKEVNNFIPGYSAPGVTACSLSIEIITIIAVLIILRDRSRDKKTSRPEEKNII